VRDADDCCEASGSSSEAGADSAGYEHADETSSSYEHVDTTHSDDDWDEGGDRNGNGERLRLGVDKVIGDGGGAVFGNGNGDGHGDERITPSSRN
jgi:class 3 adenylate cyclase